MSTWTQMVFPGKLRQKYEQELGSYIRERFVERLRSRDASLWPKELVEHNSALATMDWVLLPEGVKQFLEFLERSFREADADGLVDHALLTSESLNLSARAFLALPDRGDSRKLAVFDSAAPDVIQRNEERMDLRRTLFVLSSKARYELRDHCLFLYFQERLRAVRGAKASNQFVAETEPHTYLASLSRGYEFREMRPDSTAVLAEYCSVMHFARMLTATGTASAQEILAAVEGARLACLNSVAAESNPALQLAAFLTAAAGSRRPYLAFIASNSLIAYSRKLGQLVGGSLAQGERGLLPLIAASPLSATLLEKDGLCAILSYDGDPSSGLEQAIKELQASGTPYVHIQLKKPSDLLAESFKWEAASILACARLRLDPFAQSGSRVPRAFLREMLDQLATGQNPLQRSPRVSDGFVQIFVDGMTRREVSTLNPVEALRTFFRIATPGRHVSLLVELSRTEENYARFLTLRDMLGASLNRPVFGAFGPYAGEHFEYFHRDRLSYGPCLMITADTEVDREIPGAHYTFGQLHQLMALSEYDALVHQDRPVIRLHLADNSLNSLNHLLGLLKKALHRFQP